MALSDDLTEAMRVYYYLQTKSGNSVGGPYSGVPALAKGIARAEKRGLDKNQLVPKRMVGGRLVNLSVDEAEALTAAHEG